MTLKSVNLEDKYPHSYLSTRIRLGVLETDIYFKLNLTYMNAWAALASHAGLDIKQAMSQFDRLYSNVRNTVPFMRYDTSTKLDSSMEQSVKLYKELQAKGALDGK